jgi:cysteine desulfurase
VCFSAGSACASESGKPSRVLSAIGLSLAESRGSIRLGFGRYTTQRELVDACKQIAAAAYAQEKLDA